MAQSTAKLSKQGKHYEILIDVEEALKVKKNVGSINSALVNDVVFHNMKAGLRASSSDLIEAFGTEDPYVIAEKIIKSGEINMPEEMVSKDHEMKLKQVVDFLSKNAVDANGRPYTPERIKKALEEAHINVKNKPIESQISEILDQIRPILPIKIEVKKIRITIPAQHTGKAYGVVAPFKEDEDWLSNGDLVVTLAMPAGLVLDFYDKLNGVTHGSAFAEEIKN